MPRAALELGGADAILELDEIAQQLCRLSGAGSDTKQNGTMDD